MSAVDWGDVPTWLGAVFAAGAAGAAVWTLASQRAQIKEQREFIAVQAENLRLERHELQAAAAERRRAQADHIEVQATLVSTRRADRTATYRVNVMNASSEPLRDVTVDFVEEGVQVDTTEGPAAIGTPAFPATGPHVIRIVGANCYVTFRSSRVVEGQGSRRLPMVVFTDNDGVRWRKDSLGGLMEVAHS